MKKVIRILLISLGIFAGLILVVLINIDTILESYIKEELGKLIEKSDKNTYHLSYEKIEFHTLNGDFEIKGIKFFPKFIIKDSFQNEEFKWAVSSEIESISIKNFDYFEYFDTHHINIENINFINPEIRYYYNPKSPKNEKGLKLETTFSKHFKSAKIDKLELKNSKIRYVNALEDERQIAIDSLDINITDIELGSNSIASGFMVKVDNINITAEPLSTSLDEFYNFSTQKLFFDLKAGLFELKDFKVTPRYSEEEFNKRIPYEKVLFNIQGALLRINNLNKDSLLDAGKFYATNIKLNKIAFDFYKDKRTADRTLPKHLFSEKIRRIGIPVNIDTVRLLNSTIKFRLFPDELPTVRAGTLLLTSVFCTATGITNDSIFIDKDPIANLYFDCLLMGKGKLKIHTYFPVFNQKDLFRANGSLGSMPLDAFTDFLYDVALIDIGGQLEGANFNITGNKFSSTGKIDLEYTKLKFDIKSLKNADKSAGFLNFMVNTMLKTNNLKSQKNYVPGIIKYSRPANIGYISYLWRSLQSGIVFILAPSLKARKATKERNNALKLEK